jgi:hypothetical protein
MRSSALRGLSSFGFCHQAIANKKPYQKAGSKNRYRFYFVLNIEIGKIYLEVTEPPN